jgi:hypothetical protein
MGKFRKHLNKQNSSNGGLNHALLDDNQADDVINWQNLLVDYQNLSVQDALKNIIDKVIIDTLSRLILSISHSNINKC